MSTELTRHLDLEDLLAAVGDTLHNDAARTHFASCSICSSDAEHWRTVALGVRHLAFELTPPAAAILDEAPARDSGSEGSFIPPARTPHVARHFRRRALVGIAAAAALVIGGGFYGLTKTLGGGGRSTPSETSAVASATLTAVIGCPNLAGVSGTLAQRNGSDLVINTSDGGSVTINTAPTTVVGSEGIGTLADIVNGAEVAVNGTNSNGTITASTVTVGAKDKVKPFEPPQPTEAPLTVGTVTDDHAGGFSVVGPDGTNVAVITTSSTTVVTLQTFPVSQLRISGFTVAVGNTPGQGGTLVAGAIEQVPHPISFPRGPTSAKAGVAECSPENVVAAALKR